MRETPSGLACQGRGASAEAGGTAGGRIAATWGRVLGYAGGQTAPSGTWRRGRWRLLQAGRERVRAA
jgi:hypothetical protein